LIDENEIRMSESESKEFLTQTLEFHSDEDRIQSMVNDSNGWVGGLQLMAVAAKEQRRSIIPDLNTTDRIIGDYISNEIYRYLTNEEQDFLQKTSLLGYFNQKICEKYISQYNFNEIMGSILRKNLFVVSIDEEARVYRYHSIMKDYLTSLFNQDMEQKIQLHNQAADIFFELGDFDESLSHLFAIHAYEKIMKQLLKMPQNVLTYSYMMTVPLEELSKNRDFAYQYFFCSYASMDVDACESIYQYIIKHLKDDDTFSAFKHSDLFFNVNLMYLNVNTLSLEQIDAMPLNLVTKAYLLIKESYFLFLGDQSSEAFLYLDKAQEIYEETANPFIGVFVLSEKTQILESNGELKQALLMYNKMEKFLESVPTLKSSYYIGLAGVYIKQLALTKAKETLVLAQETLGGNVTNLNCAYLYTLAELSYTIGEHEKTEQIISDLSKEELYQNIFITARLLRYPIYRGNHNRLAVQFAKDYEAADNLLKNLDVQLLYAGIIYDNGEENKALQIVDSLIARARKTQNKLKIVEGDLLKTRFLLEHEGRAREVLNIFLEAVAYAYENTIAIPFWFEKETVEIIINKFHVDIEKKLSTTELKFIQECIKDNKENDLEIVTVKGYDLTEREIEVLEEMKKGYSNKQIAENLCISLATVKSHIINIYGKLGVNNRVAAINKINS